jgi:hypothetical protein
MAPRTISRNGIDESADGREFRDFVKKDPNHNEFIDTEQMLVDGFFQRMAGIQAPADGKEGPDDGDGTFFMTPSRARRRMRNERVAKSAGDKGDQASGKDEMDAQDRKAANILDKVKSEMIALYTSSAEDIQNLLEKMIGGIESVQALYGYESVPFDRDRYLSGLDVSEADILVNASSALDTTVKRYKAHAINSITSELIDGKPAIKAAIIGQEGGTGFIAKVMVVAKTDFNGNEAIDFVPESGGIFTVKAFRAGRWVDVSDRFVIQGKVHPYKMEKGDETHPHSVFIGEKIATEGKDILTSQLNLNSNNVRFGKHQVFCRNAADADRIKKCIRVSTQE